MPQPRPDTAEADTPPVAGTAVHTDDEDTIGETRAAVAPAWATANRIVAAELRHRRRCAEPDHCLGVVGLALDAMYHDPRALREFTAGVITHLADNTSAVLAGGGDPT